MTSADPLTSADPPPKPSHLAYGDALRVIAAVGVVLQHIAHAAIIHIADSGSWAWWLGSWVNSGTRWVVPVFVMLSGALMLTPGREIEFREFYRKRVRRIGIPTLFWSAFYMTFSVVVLKVSLPSVFDRLIHGVPYFHLHFMFIILGLYIVTPALSRWMGQMDRPLLTRATITILSVTAIATSIGWVDENRSNLFSLWIPYVGYYMLGYLLRDTVCRGRRLLLVFLCFASSLAVVGLQSGYSFLRHGWTTPGPWLNEFSGPGVMLLSASTFLLLAQIPSAKTERAQSVVAKLAGATMGVYLVHPFLISVMQRLGLHRDVLDPAIVLPALFLSVTLLSWIVVLIGQRTRIGRAVFG